MQNLSVSEPTILADELRNSERHLACILHSFCLDPTKYRYLVFRRLTHLTHAAWQSDPLSYSYPPWHPS